MKPYYEQDGITVILGDCREYGPFPGAILLTDPPYGISYESGHYGSLPRSIVGDTDTSLRDFALEQCWHPDGAALVFGSWRAPRPRFTRMVLVWDTKGANGMGALDLPWKPAHQEIYVLGSGFSGPRTTDVLSFAPVQSLARNGRVHPHEKPVDLLQALLLKSPPGSVVDPFCGSGSTLVAAKKLGRTAIGIEIEERYCEIAARRLDQQVLDLGGV